MYIKLFVLGREAAFISPRLGHSCLFVGRSVRPSAGLLPQRFQQPARPPVASHNKSGHCALDSPPQDWTKLKPAEWIHAALSLVRRPTKHPCACDCSPPLPKIDSNVLVKCSLMPSVGG